MSRDAAISAIESYFDDGLFFSELGRRVAYRTESPNPAQKDELTRYLSEELKPELVNMGFQCDIHSNPDPTAGPLLVARRHENDRLPTVMTYAHGDVVLGYDEQWKNGLNPWVVQRDGDRIYGRGTADNKGQHTINLAALRSVLNTRGHLGYNMVILVETGEERGSPGLGQFCKENKSLFKADVFIASDGPRMQPETPTVFMGSREVFNFTLSLELREGGHHSGNWGGLLANPGVIMANAIASIIDKNGKILVDGWQSPPMSDAVRQAISSLSVGGGADGPTIDPNWGEPGLTPEERVFGTNTFEIRAFETGNPRNPVNAIPPRATAHGHLRYVAGTNENNLLPALRKHLNKHGYQAIEITSERPVSPATRLDPDHPWAKWAIQSIRQTSKTEVAVLPNLGGTLPNAVFADTLGLPTIWVPHSYAGCSQHAPNEHLLAPVCRDALRIMAGLWWDLGSEGTPSAETLNHS
ncbi:MAG: M20 family metallopeptidase [Burkholderiaceae bacterium]